MKHEEMAHVSNAVKFDRGTGTFLQGPALREWIAQQEYRGLRFLPVSVDGQRVGQQAIEVFHCPRDYKLTTEDGEQMEHGWYWWYCMPACMPDSDPTGPFKDAKSAHDDAKEECAQ